MFIFDGFVIIAMFLAGYQAGLSKKPEVVDLFPKEKEQVTQSRQLNSRAVVTHFSIPELKGKSGSSIPLNIALEGKNLSLQTMLLFRGIPEGVRFKSGIHREGIWSIPYIDLKKAELIVPGSYMGTFSYEVFLFKDKESSPIRIQSKVSIE